MKIKKQIPVILIILLSVNFITAQNEYGTIKYTVSHDWTKKMESNEFISQAQKEQSSYVWGNNNLYSEYAILEFSPDAYLYKMIENNDDPGEYSWKSNEYIIYRDIKNNATYDIIRTLNNLYVIEDSISYQNWKIRNDMKEVAGHICMNAYYRDTIKDKDIIAWFALDIPLSYGPKRYGGLPGMIMEINMNNGAVVITATDISFSEEKNNIEKPTHKKKIKKVTEEEFDDIIYKFIQQTKKNKRPYFYTISY
ncbi:MAG: GLPGLI family protein [Bacteroidales bacterium]|jgi:GLPGLI family protein|nr:GLPGLI family protein [Bacteroidales bacterium]